MTESRPAGAAGPDQDALRSPATRDQADAYRFAVRRWETALVRGDPVLRHEQVRSARRAVLAGVVLGLLGLCGAAVVARIAPSPAWQAQQIVVGRDSGSLHVVAHDPDRLVPVPNLAAARLVLAALGAPDPAAARPVVVPDATLDTAARTPAAALPGVDGRLDLPGPVPRWAVCDTVDADGALLATTVVGAATVPSGAAAAAERVLLAGPDDSTWLVTAGHRHRVDVGDGAVLAAYRLARVLPRRASDQLLSAIPEGVALATPAVPDRGVPAPDGLPGRVGDVFVSTPVDGAPQHFVVFADGLAEVPAGAAELLRIAAGGTAPAVLDPDVLAAAPVTAATSLLGWPEGSAAVLEPGQAGVTCWTWDATTPGAPTSGVWLGSAVPAGQEPMDLAGGDGPGPAVDAVAVGVGGPVRATAPGRAPGAGPVWYLSAGGVAHGVADDATAAALGLPPASPGPETVLRMLPQGPILDAADAGRVIDVPGGR